MSGSASESHFSLPKSATPSSSRFVAPVEAKLELVGHDVRSAFLAESRLLSSLSAHVMQMPGKKFRPRCSSSWPA